MRANWYLFLSHVGCNPTLAPDQCCHKHGIKCICATDLVAVSVQAAALAHMCRCASSVPAYFCQRRAVPRACRKVDPIWQAMLWGGYWFIHSILYPTLSLKGQPKRFTKPYLKTLFYIKLSANMSNNLKKYNKTQNHQESPLKKG